MVTGLPIGPEFGLRLFILGVTVKLTELLVWPATLMTTGPVVVPEGTGTVMLVALQLVGVAAVPLKVIVLVPWVAPKLVPVTVIGVPMPAAFGDRLLIEGDAAGLGIVTTES